MKKSLTITKDIAAAESYLATIKREVRRLQVRMIAIERFYRVAKTEQETATGDEDLTTDLLENIEALQFDLSTYLKQVEDRFQHISQGLATVTEINSSRTNSQFINYITEDARLCARDIAVAREGYDELIENLNELTHLRDNDQ